MWEAVGRYPGEEITSGSDIGSPNLADEMMPTIE